MERRICIGKTEGGLPTQMRFKQESEPSQLEILFFCNFNSRQIAKWSNTAQNSKLLFVKMTEKGFVLTSF